MAVVEVDEAPGGGLQAAGGGAWLGPCKALAAIVALAWLLLWVGVVVGSVDGVAVLTFLTWVLPALEVAVAVWTENGVQKGD